MNDTALKIVSSVVCAAFFSFMTFKAVGAMQQGGYHNASFLRWLRRRDNLFFNRLSILSLCLLLSSTLTALCFCFLGKTWALCISAVPFLLFLTVFICVDFRYALKVPIKCTGRFCRLFAVYFLIVFGTTWGVAEGLYALSNRFDLIIFAVIAYAPFAAMPMLLPTLLCIANAMTSVFEKARNRRFVRRATDALDNAQVIRVGIVGSFGKTSVKGILTAILSERYQVVATPESYNTPIGIAKTVFSPNFQGAQVLIAEMGARKRGDIQELCQMVKPNFGIFTGVCEQHVSSFKSLENIFEEKSEIIKSGAKVVCAPSLQERVHETFGELEQVLYANQQSVKDVALYATHTKFKLRIGDAWIDVDSKLLGCAAVENILLAATLASAMGLTAQEIARGISNMQAVPHRLQLIKQNGVYILDDGYNANPRSAVEALAALGRFDGRKCVITPGIVECGVLEEKINRTLGEEIARSRLDCVILVGDTLVELVKKGYEEAGGDIEALHIVRSIEDAKELLSRWVQIGDAILFLNDLPDVY